MCSHIVQCVPPKTCCRIVNVYMDGGFHSFTHQSQACAESYCIHVRNLVAPYCPPTLHSLQVCTTRLETSIEKTSVRTLIQSTVFPRASLQNGSERLRVHTTVGSIRRKQRKLNQVGACRSSYHLIHANTLQRPSVGNTAAAQVFAIPELLETIITLAGGANSVSKIRSILLFGSVSQDFRAIIRRSVKLQRAIWCEPDLIEPTTMQLNPLLVALRFNGKRVITFTKNYNKASKKHWMWINPKGLRDHTVEASWRRTLVAKGSQGSSLSHGIDPVEHVRYGKVWMRELCALDHKAQEKSERMRTFFD